MHAKLLQSCPTLCDSIDGSLPGSSVPGILQARILEWVATSFSNACMHAKSLQSCLTLCDPMDSSPPGSSVPGILQARTLEWVAISFSNACMHAKSLQSCPTLCNPIDGSPPGASIPGILQARILEWVAISFSNACMHAKSLQSRSTLQPYGQQPTRLLYPWDFLGKSNGVGCHCLLQPSVLEKVKRDERNTQLKIDFWATKRNQHEFLERKMG